MSIFLKKQSCFRLFIWVPVLTIPVLYTHSTVDANIHIRFVALSIYLLALCVFSYSLLKRTNPVSFPSDTIFVLFLLYATLSLPGCMLSPFLSGNGLFEWIKILLLPSFVLLMATVFSRHPDFMNDLSKSITVLSCLAISYGIYQFMMVASKMEITHHALYAVKTTFAHKNIFSEILFVMLPFPLYCFLSSKRIWRWIGLLSAFFSIVFIIILMTRAVWIAFAIGGFALLFLFLSGIARKKTVRIDRRTFLTLFIFTALMLFGIAIYACYDKENTFVKQVTAIFNFEYGSTKERIILWKHSLEIFMEHPLWGAGMGNWHIEILKYGSRGLASENTTTFYQRPHNDFLWILTEQGIFAFLLYILILISVFYNLIKIITHTQNSNDRMFFYLLFFGFTGYCAFSFFSFPKERAEHLLFMSFTIASVLIYKRKIFPIQDSHLPFSILPIIFIVGIFSLSVSAIRLRSEKHLAQAFNARQSGEWKTMISELDLAESFFYRMDPVSTPLRWYRGLANFNLNNTQDAFYDFKQAYSYNPYHIHVLNNLGTCCEMAGNHTEAIDYFKRAIELSPTFDEARFNLCASCYNAGNGKEAYQQLRKISPKKMFEKYNDFLTFVLPSGIKTMRDTADEETKKHIDRIQNTDDWMNQIHFKSIENNVSLEKQLMLDLIYVLDSVEKDTKEASRLKNKYSIILK